MKSARRAFAVSLALIAPLLAAASASGAIVINEVESSPVDFVELYNTDASAADISGYVVDDESANPGSGIAIPGGTMIAGGGYYLAASPGLGNPDAVHLFNAASASIDNFPYGAHAAATYGRCPNGTGGIGALTWTLAPTPGSANSCPAAASVWPGGTAVSLVDDAATFATDVSGLAYEPSGTSAPGVLWAVSNLSGTLYRLLWNGTTWAPDTANGWALGKPLHYPAGLGIPDAEGVTVADGAVYVATERDGGGVSRPAVLRFDVTGAGSPLNATNDWNLTADLPGLADNAGPEAITWIPDDFLVSKGFVDGNTGLPYNPANYANHGSGLFFVGIEQDGRIVAYALDQTGSGFTRIESIASGFPAAMALEYEAESGHLWAACDNSCDGRLATLDVAQSGVNDGQFVVTNQFDRPTGMPNVNNEGFAIAPQAECANGVKPAIWADDDDTGGNTLRAGTLNCAGSGGADTTLDGSVSAKATQKQKGKKIKVAINVDAAEALTAKAAGKVKAGRASYALKPLTRNVDVGSVVLKLKPKKSKDAGKIAKVLATGKKAKAKVKVELRDAAGNSASETLGVKLKG